MAKYRDLDEVIKNKWLVEFSRKPIDKYPLYGFVLDWNDDFTLIQEFDADSYALDGYCIFKNKSVKNFRVYDTDEYFLSEVIKVKRLMPKATPKILLENWQSILQTVNDTYNLVVIESEALYKDQCNIGRLDKLGKKKFGLIEISPDAVWDKQPTKYAYKHLTKVGFGDLYVNTLWRVSEARKNSKR